MFAPKRIRLTGADGQDEEEVFAPKRIRLTVPAALEEEAINNAFAEIEAEAEEDAEKDAKAQAEAEVEGEAEEKAEKEAKADAQTQTADAQTQTGEEADPKEQEAKDRALMALLWIVKDAKGWKRVAEWMVNCVEDCEAADLQWQNERGFTSAPKYSWRDYLNHWKSSSAQGEGDACIFEKPGLSS